MSAARRTAGALAAAALAAGTLLAGTLLAGAPAAAAAPAAAVGSADVALAGPVQPPAPDARTVSSITVPLSITNTGSTTLYDVRVGSLRSAPLTSPTQLQSAFDAGAVVAGPTTQSGPVQPLPAALPPHTSTTFSYVVDSGADPATGICLCYLGDYALDLDVSAAAVPGGRSAQVGRVQTYLPSLTRDQTAPMAIGWLWPLLDRPHREIDGSVFTDDELAASVSPGGRLDRALAAVEDVDAADPGASIRMLLLLDPEVLDELVTMTRGYTVELPGHAPTAGTGGPAAARWLARLAAVLPRHDVRFTAPADPDVTGLATRGISVTAALTPAASGAVAAALGLFPAALPAHDLAWPAGGQVDRTGLAVLASGGTRTVVLRGSAAGTGPGRSGDVETDGSVAEVQASPTGAATTALVADPTLSDQAGAAVSAGHDTASALQRLVATTAMTGVTNPDDSRFVLVTPGRDADVDPAAAARAVVATSGMGTPTSPLAAAAGGGPLRPELLASSSPPPSPTLGRALTTAAAAAGAGEAVRAAVVGDADSVVGDLPGRIQRAASTNWGSDPTTAARYADDLQARAAALTAAVQVVVNPDNSYSLASQDAPLLITVSNQLTVPIRVRVDVTPVRALAGFHAGNGTAVEIPAGSRPTLRIPTTVARAGRFEVLVTLRSVSGATIGTPATLTVTSSAVGRVALVVTYSAGILLVLALLMRGVRRRRTRSRAGSTATPTGTPTDTPSPGTGAAPAPGGDRSEGSPTVRAAP